ncbi:MAG: AbrB/MazE/SpoVT family DNA-binding domain-containing protein [Candidatus Eisenbacteria bacterium]|nr:AbrB/MazE/SpoVT family DNA-binding domain-containing protein [Candidatus Eisenbacteria bacterium]
MDTVTISPKFQVVIPLAIRKALSLKPGQKIGAIVLEGNIVLVPVRPVAEYRGILKGPNDFERDKADRY